MAGSFHVHYHTGVLTIVNVNGIYFRDVLLLIISRGANSCVQCVFEKNIIS